ncbi:MAG: acyltransferase family protein [Phycisphaerae bacterium]|nr:acyltransferase family protein [Phycisphaerae bacterium]
MAESSISSKFLHPSTSYIDVLRIVASFFVVLAHVAGGSADNFVVFSNPWWLCKGLFFFCLWTIPVFVMMSGALLLSHAPTSIRAFYRRRFTRIGVPLVFWTIFYLGLRLVLDQKSWTLPQILDLLLQGNAYYHLWFLYMIAGLYLVTPYLQILAEHLTTRQCLAAILLILIGADIFHLCNVMMWGTRPSVFALFVPYMGYYLLGYIIHHKWPKGRLPGLWVAAGTAISVVYLMCLAHPFIQLRSQQYGIFFFGFFSAPIACMAIGIYWAFRETCIKPLNPRLQHLASCTLGIYIVHLLVLKLMQIGLADEVSDHHIWVGLVFGTLIGFALSYGLVSLIKKIPVICRIVG